MPKELHEIKNFMTGTITTPSETDIPDDAASYSLNIDPVAEDGILKGIPDDITLKTDGTFGTSDLQPLDADKMAMINNDGQRDVVAYEAGANKIWNIVDFQGGASGYITGTTFACVNSNPDTITDSGNGFVSAGFVAGKQITVTGFTDSANNGTFVLKTVAAGTLTLDDSHALAAESAGDTVIISSLVIDKGAQTNSTDTCTMQVNNKEVHIGMGKGVTDKPLWCGIINHGHFAADAPTGLQLVDGELTSPSSFTSLTKVFCNEDESYIFGYQIDTRILYKFDIASGKLVIRSAPGLFAYDITAACRADGEDFIWVSTLGASNQMLHKVDMEDLTILFTCQTTLSNTHIAHDIINIKANSGAVDKLWMANMGAGGGRSLKLYRMNTPSVGGTPAWTEVTPEGFDNQGSGLDHTDVGNWMYYGVSWTAFDILFKQATETYGNVLFKPADDFSGAANAWVGVLTQVTPAVGTPDDLWFVYDSGCTHTSNSSCPHRVKVWTDDGSENQGLIVALIMRDDFANGDYLDDAKADGAITTQNKGGLVLIDTTENLQIQSICGTNDDTFLVSIEAASSKSDLKGLSIPNGGSVFSGATLPFDAESLSNADLHNAVGVCIKDGGTKKFHVFAGETDARWAYGELDALATKTETELSITLSDEATGGSLVSGTAYSYKASFVYDGYQSSPLTPIELAENTPSGSNHSHVLLLTMKNMPALNKRITHVNIYAQAGLGFYRLVESVDIRSAWFTNASTTSNPDWGQFMTKTIVDTGVYGASYEALNGISEVIRDTLPYYSLSAQLNNTHFIANCKHPNFKDSDSFLFKSKPYNFNQFDWSLDLLRLPTKPTAMASFSGRLYVFDDDNTYRIEPNELYIEDIFEGVGCIGPEAIVVTEYGMCFADANNIYLHSGSQPTPIGEAILRGDTKSWQSRDKTWASKVTFDAERNSFVVMFKQGSSYYAWSFNIARKRWDLWEIFGTTQPLGTLTGKSGEIFISNGTNLVHYLGGTGTDNWDWYSKKLTMGQDTQIKNFKKTRISGNTGDSIDTFLSSEGTPADSGATDGALDYVYTLSGAASRAKWLQYKITAESNTVDAIGTIYRRRSVR